MKNLVVNSIMNNITKYYNYDDTRLDEIKYGIESLYLTISKTIIILIGCIILKIVNPEDFGEFYYELRATIDPEDVDWYVSFDTPF